MTAPPPPRAGYQGISRYFVILLAFVVCGVRASQGAWVETAGLFGLGGGLAMLKIAERRPAVRPLAWVGFAMTVVAMVVVFLRTRQG